MTLTTAGYLILLFLIGLKIWEETKDESDSEGHRSEASERRATTDGGGRACQDSSEGV